MDRTAYINHQRAFKTLTNLDADENLVAFFSYLHLLKQNELKSLIATIHLSIIEMNKTLENITKKQG